MSAVDACITCWGKLLNSLTAHWLKMCFPRSSQRKISVFHFGFVSLSVFFSFLGGQLWWASAFTGSQSLFILFRVHWQINFIRSFSSWSWYFTDLCRIVPFCQAAKLCVSRRSWISRTSGYLYSFTLFLSLVVVCLVCLIFSFATTIWWSDATSVQRNAVTSVWWSPCALCIFRRLIILPSISLLLLKWSWAIDANL